MRAESIGVYPGTFDPITFGHMDIIRRALKVVDKLIIGVALDTTKKPAFGLHERANMIEKDLGEILSAGDASRCTVKPFSGLLMKFAATEGAGVIIRGLRAISDFEYEVQMACLNQKLSADIETIFLPASDSTQFISSRFIKEISRLGGDVSHFVSKNVERELARLYTAESV